MMKKLLLGACMSEVELCIVDSAEAFWLMEAEWQAFFARCAHAANVFQSFEFLSHWMRVYHEPDDRLAIVVGRANGEMEFLWPLVIQKVWGVRQLRTMGAPVSQYSDAIMAARPDRDAIVARALSLVLTLKVDLVRLGAVRDDAVIAKAAGGPASLTCSYSAAPVIMLENLNDLDAFETRFKPRMRQDIRRNARRLAETGNVEYVSQQGGVESVALVAAATRLKRDWVLYKGHVSATVLDPRFEDFLTRCATDPTLGRNMNVSAILRDGAPIAVEMSIACKDGLFAYLLSHDVAYERFGPGRLVVRQSIASAIKGGYNVYDLLAPADAYKTELACQSVQLRDIMYAKNWIGLSYAVLWVKHGRPIAKACMHRLPLVVGRFLARRVAQRARFGSAGAADVL